MRYLNDDYTISKRIPLDINYIFKVFFIPNYLIDDLTLTKRFYIFLRARVRQVAEDMGFEYEDLMALMVFLIYGKKVLVDYKKAFAEDELYFPMPYFKFERVAQKFNFNVKAFLTSIGITSSHLYLNPSKLLAAKVFDMRGMTLYLSQMPLKGILKKTIPLSYANMSSEIGKANGELDESVNEAGSLLQTLYAKKFKELNPKFEGDATSAVDELMKKYGITMDAYVEVVHKVIYQMAMPDMHFPIIFESELGSDSFMYLWKHNKVLSRVPESSLSRVLENLKISGTKIFFFAPWSTYNLKYANKFKNIFTPDKPGSEVPGTTDVIFLTRSGHKIMSELFEGIFSFLKINFATRYANQHLTENRFETFRCYSKKVLLDNIMDGMADRIVEDEMSKNQMDLFDKSGTRAEKATEFYLKLGIKVSPEDFHERFKELDELMGAKKVRSFFSGAFFMLGAVITKKGFELPCTVARFEEEIEKLPAVFHTKYAPHEVKMILAGDKLISIREYEVGHPIMTDVHMSEKDVDGVLYEVVDFINPKVGEALKKFFEFLQR